MDELFETLTLMQTKKVNGKAPIVLVWKRILGRIDQFQYFGQMGHDF